MICPMTAHFDYYGQQLYEKLSRVIEYVQRQKKNGELGRRIDIQVRKYSPILICECCGFKHGKKRVRHTFTWADPAGEKGENGWNGKVFKTLCLSCMFTLDAARRKWLACEKLKTDVNRLRKKINESTKNNAGIA